jgi:hypothetical protein
MRPCDMCGGSISGAVGDPFVCVVVAGSDKPSVRCAGCETKEVSRALPRIQRVPVAAAPIKAGIKGILGGGR